MIYETILVEVRARVQLITLNRPDVLNALDSQLTKEIFDAVALADASLRDRMHSHYRIPQGICSGCRY
jgi:enoyl-CoA hydratase/carnithine racemase